PYTTLFRSISNPQFALISPPPRTCMALRAFASVRMQLVPRGGMAVVMILIATIERATSVGVGIGLIIPRLSGSNDAFVLSHCKVSWVISTTTQGGVEQWIGRASTALTGSQLSPV